MTDNRTTELRVKLTERGAKWTESRYSGARHAEHTKWTTAGGSHAKYTEYDDGHTVMTIEARNLTPEQAIAATLGNEREKALEKLARSLYADYRNEWPDRAEEVYADRMEELGIEVGE